MRSRVVLVGAMILFAMTSAWAADIAGKWTAKVPGAQGESDVTLPTEILAKRAK